MQAVVHTATEAAQNGQQRHMCWQNGPSIQGSAAVSALQPKHAAQRQRILGGPRECDKAHRARHSTSSYRLKPEVQLANRVPSTWAATHPRGSHARREHIGTTSSKACSHARQSLPCGWEGRIAPSQLKATSAKKVKAELMGSGATRAATTSATHVKGPSACAAQEPGMCVCEGHCARAVAVV